MGPALCLYMPFPRSLYIENYGQAARPISIGKLRLLPALHSRPINLVFSEGASGALRPREN